MSRDTFSTVQRQENSLLATHAVLRNTYLLLGLTMAFSAVTAYFSVLTNARPGIFLFLIGAYGFMFLTQALRHSIWGIASCFAFTGFMGYTLGPILNMFLHQYVNGGQLIMTALGGTGLIFFTLSGYALTTRRDFSGLSKFLLVGMVVLVVAMIANIFLKISVLQLAISAAFMIFSSAMILFETGRIVNNGEDNYIMATISLYVSIYNLFVSLLSILGAFNQRN